MAREPTRRGAPTADHVRRAIIWTVRVPFGLGLWTPGASEVERLREREAMFVWVRWLFSLFAVFALVADEGRWPWIAWSAPAFLAGVNVVAATLPSRLERAGPLRALGVCVNFADGVAVSGAMFNYASNVDTATGLLMMLVVLEAALRFELAGGLVAGLLAGGEGLMWSQYREAEYGFDYAWSTVWARTGAYVLGGLLLGVVISQLERAGRQVRAQLRRTDAVGRFAIDAPRLPVDEAANRLAAILHDDLEFEFAALMVVDEDDPSVFRLVAGAGYEPGVLDMYATFPISSGVVGRCFRTGEAQLLPDVSGDPDYMEVDPRTQSEMTVPLRARGTVFGAIDVASPRPGAFDEEDLRFLEAAAAQMAVAFDNARLAEIERTTIDELEALSALKDDFIAIANHELRTPVTTIAGFAQSLLKQRDVLTQDEMDDAIERIARQSAHLKRLIEDLLAVPGARGRRGLEREPVRLPDVVDEVVRELDPGDGLYEFEVAVEPSVPPIAADRSALRRVLTNLIGNAIKYSPGGGRVAVRAMPDGPLVRVDVVDEGIGIATQDIPLLFTKFGKAAGTEDGGGMGLGLFIVRELVEDMGGDVGVESEPGRGSRFWFRLPTARQSVSA